MKAANSVLSEGSYEPGMRAARALIILGSSQPLALFSWVHKQALWLWAQLKHSVLLDFLVLQGDDIFRPNSKTVH